MQQGKFAWNLCCRLFEWSSASCPISVHLLFFPKAGIASISPFFLVLCGINFHTSIISQYLYLLNTQFLVLWNSAVMGREGGEKSLMLHVMIWCFKNRKYSKNWSGRWGKEVEASYIKPVTWLEVGTFLFHSNYSFFRHTWDRSKSTPGSLLPLQ